MIYTSIANVPDSLREFISTCVEEKYQEFEGLKKDHEAAVRNRQFGLASHISEQLGEHMQPSNPAITIVGGSGGYFLVDENDFHLHESRFSSRLREVSAEFVHGRVSTAVGLSPYEKFPHLSLLPFEYRP